MSREQYFLLLKVSNYQRRVESNIFLLFHPTKLILREFFFNWFSNLFYNINYLSVHWLSFGIYTLHHQFGIPFHLLYLRPIFYWCQLHSFFKGHGCCNFSWTRSKIGWPCFLGLTLVDSNCYYTKLGLASKLHQHSKFLFIYLYLYIFYVRQQQKILLLK